MVSKFKVTKPLLKKIVKWAQNGLNRKDIGILLGYSPNHFYTMMKTYPEITVAYNEGRVEMKSLLQNRVFTKAMSDDKDSLNASTYLLNRHHPADSDIDPTDTTIEGASDEDIIRKIKIEIQ